MRNLRTQLLASHIALVALMAIMVAGAIASFVHLGQSIDRILRNNYKTVAAMQEIRDTLDRENEVALMAMSGRQSDALDLHRQNIARFDSAFDVQKHNITESGERELTDELGRQDYAYRSQIEDCLRSVDPSVYESRLKAANDRVARQAEQILHLNEAAMKRADERARAEARQASFIGVALTIGATIIAFVFALRASAVRREEELSQQRDEIEHLREVDRMKTEFIGVASHELRTPVTSLLLSSQLLKEGAAGDLSKRQVGIVDAQLDDLQRLDSVMRDLLDLSRLESGAAPPVLKQVAVVDLAREAVRAVETHAIDQGVTIDNQADGSDLSVQADRAMITRVLVNLLDNAIRHSPSGTRIEIDVRPSVGTPHAASSPVAFSVRDHGAGIAREQLGRIFERFSQVPGATGGGAGLGLSIAEQIIKAHGGEMRVDSQEGRGSIFTFTLPASEGS